LLTVAWRKQQAREDRRAAMAAWILANVNRDSKTRPEPFGLEEVVAWLGHGFASPEPAAQGAATPPSVDEFKAKFEALHQMYQASKGQNGTGES
jgi:hypothetical protein